MNLTNLRSGYDQWGGRQTQTATTSSLSLWGVLFHEKGAQKGAQSNATLRDLDQSWRLDPENRDEAILVARVETVNGLAKDILGDPAGASPTKLWLKGCRSRGRTRRRYRGRCGKRRTSGCTSRSPRRAGGSSRLTSEPRPPGSGLSWFKPAP